MTEEPSPQDWPCVVQELVPAPSPEEAFARFGGLPYCLFLDSARSHESLGRYSFLAADPFHVVARTLTQSLDRNGNEDRDFFATVAELAAEFRSPTLPELPPFQGGLAGVFSYDLAHETERLPRAEFDDFQLPTAVVGFYDLVIAWDHRLNRAWIVSHGWPERDPALKRVRALARIEETIARLENPRRSSDPALTTGPEPKLLKATAIQGVQSNFTRDEYLAAVRRTIEYIRAGDAFQVNLAQRLTCLAPNAPWRTYLRLRQRNPATFGGYFDAGDFQILSASPERFLQVRGTDVETRPIKGTRPRTVWPEADLFAGDDLLASEKDRAENIMIVDLMRNDLSRVCEPDGVRVTKLCGLELYETVQHLVSVVTGKLSPEKTVWDLLRAAWPGGSITGAPKIRAMEIITELERVARGPYCGSLFYAGFDGTFDANLLIRTMIQKENRLVFSVGGGITTASVPEREYEETWHKAAGLLRAL